MKWLSKIVWTLIFCVLINIHESRNPAEQDLTKIVIKHVKEDTEINQIVLLLDDDVKISTENVIQNLPNHFPSWAVSFLKGTENIVVSLSMLQSFSSPRGMLFVIITSSSCSDHVLDNLSRPINYMTKLSGAKRRPKVLIVIKVKKMVSYENLFRYMWSKKFLDVTILEFQSKPQNQTVNRFIDDQQELRSAANQHLFNPFNYTFAKQNYSSRSELFPDKLRDLHSYKLKAAFFHFPPHVIFTRNSTGDIIKVDGPDVRLMIALSEAMNFKLLKDLSNSPYWDKISCITEENEGFFHALVYSKIQFMGIQCLTVTMCDVKLMEQSTSIGQIQLVAVVPILKEQNTKLSTDWKLYNLMALLILIILMWLITRLLRFNNENWNLHDLIRIVLGSAIPREPSALAERIVLGSMLVSFLLHSSVIFTAFTNINLQKNSLEEIDTLDQLISSDLKPLLHPNIYGILSKFREEKSTRLSEKAVQQYFTNSECLQILASHKNVTCIFRGTIAKWLLQSRRDQDREPTMRIVSESVANFIKIRYMEPSSPYVKRLEETSMRLVEAGIVHKWDEIFFDKPEAEVTLADILISDVVESNVQIRINIIFVLFFGYTCSLLVYLGEVAIYFYKKFFF